MSVLAGAVLLVEVEDPFGVMVMIITVVDWDVCGETELVLSICAVVIEETVSGDVGITEVVALEDCAEVSCFVSEADVAVLVVV